MPRAEGSGGQTFESLVGVLGANEDVLRTIIDSFRAEGVSLLTPYGSAGRPLAATVVIDLSHEVLIRAWPRIADPNISSKSGRPKGWLHREFEDGLIWRALAVQAGAFADDPQACLDPATTKQRWPWWCEIQERPAWALRYFVRRTGQSDPLKKNQNGRPWNE